MAWDYVAFSDTDIDPWCLALDKFEWNSFVVTHQIGFCIGAIYLPFYASCAIPAATQRDFQIHFHAVADME